MKLLLGAAEGEAYFHLLDDLRHEVSDLEIIQATGPSATPAASRSSTLSTSDSDIERIHPSAYRRVGAMYSRSFARAKSRIRYWVSAITAFPDWGFWAGGHQSVNFVS